MNELLKMFKEQMEAQAKLAKEAFEKKAELWACLNDDNKPNEEKNVAAQLLQIGQAYGHNMEPA